MAGRKAKWTEIWDSGYYGAHVYGTFYARFLEFRLGSFSALCKILMLRFLKRRLLPQFSFNFNQTLL